MYIYILKDVKNERHSLCVRTQKKKPWYVESLYKKKNFVKKIYNNDIFAE